MQARNVLTIYRKELTDFLRDRRTILSLMVVPLLVMPVFMLGTAHFASRSRQAAQQKRFVVAIRQQAPIAGLNAALEKAGFDTREAADPRQAVESKSADLGVETLAAEKGLTVRVYLETQAEVESGVARRRVLDALGELKDERVRADLKRAGVSETLLQPFRIDSVNIAPPRKTAGSFLGTALGFMLVVFMLSGGMYPAIDMTAGEKERRTMEMLLSSAASREEIVLGKLLATLSATLATAALSVLSFGVSFFGMRRMGPPDQELARLTGLSIDGGTLALMLLSSVPMAILAASTTLAVAVSARSHKEATSYVTPLLFAGMFLGLLTVLPGVKWTPQMALVPVANFNKVIKDLLMGDWSWGVFTATLAANTFYAALGVAAAVRNFRNESILFRT